MSADNTVEEKPKRRRKRAAAEEEEIVEEQEADRSLTATKGKATPGRRARQQETSSGNIVTRPIRGMREYLRGVNDELQKVTWPDRDELRRLTVIVIAVTIAASLALGAVAFAFSELFIIGLTENQEWVFLAFGAAVIVLFGLIRMRQRATP